jgi:hypothetical protein
MIHQLFLLIHTDLKNLGEMVYFTIEFVYVVVVVSSPSVSALEKVVFEEITT